MRKLSLLCLSKFPFSHAQTLLERAMCCALANPAATVAMAAAAAYIRLWLANEVGPRGFKIAHCISTGCHAASEIYGEEE